MLFRIVLSLCIIFGLSFGVSNEAQKIKGLYKSLAKDFVIYQFLKDEKTSKEDAYALLDEPKRMTSRLKSLFEKRLKIKNYFLKKYCAKLEDEEYEKKCNPLRVTPFQFQKMSLKQQKALYKKVSTIYSKKELLWMRAMIAKDTFSYLLKHDDGSHYLKIFNSVNKKYKQKVLDKKMTLDFLTKLANQKRFKNFILHVTTSNDYKKLPINLLHVNPKREILPYKSAFYLGILAIKKQNPQKAYKFFQRAKDESKHKSTRDKALFWQYMATKDISLLKQVANSVDLNFYSLYAKEQLKKVDFTILRPSPSTKKLEHYSITDPFSWAFTQDYIKDMNKSTIKKFAQKFYTQETLGHYAYMMERASGYKENYFPTPYEKYLNDTNASRKVLIYSIARQESRFIPAAVSTSYALGMMQFMPFLAKATAKDEKISDFKYFDMFEPKIALHFANIHLDYLESFLYHPLFVSYAYNGGIGFTRRMLTKEHLFQKGKYEPFLSIELVPYGESRKYGKKVLTNYVQYANLYGLNVTLTALLEKLKKPHENDLFRKRESK